MDVDIVNLPQWLRDSEIERKAMARRVWVILIVGFVLLATILAYHGYKLSAAGYTMGDHLELLALYPVLMALFFGYHSLGQNKALIYLHRHMQHQYIELDAPAAPSTEQGQRQAPTELTEPWAPEPYRKLTRAVFAEDIAAAQAYADLRGWAPEDWEYVEDTTDIGGISWRGIHFVEGWDAKHSDERRQVIERVARATSAVVYAFRCGRELQVGSELTPLQAHHVADQIAQAAKKTGERST